MNRPQRRQPGQRKSLAGEWRTYERVVLPPNAPGVLRKVTRRAFYAGAASLFGAIMEGLTEDREPTKDDLDYMTSLANELADFGALVEHGRA